MSVRRCRVETISPERLVAAATELGYCRRMNGDEYRRRRRLSLTNLASLSTSTAPSVSPKTRLSVVGKVRQTRNDAALFIVYRNASQLSCAYSWHLSLLLSNYDYDYDCLACVFSIDQVKKSWRAWKA